MTAKIIEFKKKQSANKENIPTIEIGMCEDGYIALFQNYATADKGNILILEKSKVTDMIECLKEYMCDFGDVS